MQRFTFWLSVIILSQNCYAQSDSLGTADTVINRNYKNAITLHLMLYSEYGVAYQRNFKPFNTRIGFFITDHGERRPLKSILTLPFSVTDTAVEYMAVNDISNEVELRIGLEKTFLQLYSGNTPSIWLNGGVDFTLGFYQINYHLNRYYYKYNIDSVSGVITYLDADLNPVSSPEEAHEYRSRFTKSRWNYWSFGATPFVRIQSNPNRQFSIGFMLAARFKYYQLSSSSVDDPFGYFTPKEDSYFDGHFMGYFTVSTNF